MELFVKKLSRNELGLTGAKTHGEIYVPLNCLEYFPKLNDAARPQCSFTVTHQVKGIPEKFTAFITLYAKGEVHLRRMKPVLGSDVQPNDFLLLRRVDAGEYEATIVKHEAFAWQALESLRGTDVGMVLDKDLVHLLSTAGDGELQAISGKLESPLSSSGLIDLRRLEPSATVHPLADGTPPNWASEWGHDEFGPWCSFDVDGIQQRLRWIPPGQFQRGVAEEFEGLFDEYGPRHWVTLTRGFWMFETKCSTELYNRVMLTSRKTDTASLSPAVRMNIWEAQRFCSLLSDHLGTVSVSLPTDAQWEFACRAGRQDGPHFNLDFDRVDSSNPWGLRSMLSGTGEFCSDGPRLYSDKAVVDPLGDEEGVVIRGLPRSIPGALRYNSQSTIDEESTISFERKTHPSFRYVVEPTSSIPDVGFRCIIAEENWKTATLLKESRPE